jgi:hypothetical protein
MVSGLKARRVRLMSDSKVVKPFDLELSRYAAKFARAVYIGGPPPFSPSTYMASATMTLLKFGGLFIGITCQHVLVRYRELLETHANIIFQVGQAQFNPVQYLIAEDKERDLVTIDVTSFVNKIEEGRKSSFIEPVSWPPGEVSEKDVICLAGFPGIWREKLSLGHLRFFSFSTGATFVQSVGDERFAVRPKAEEGIVTIDRGMVLGSLGGMSGGPVFCWRKKGLLWAEFVGFIYEHQETFDIMLVRAAKVLNRDGTFV